MEKGARKGKERGKRDQKAGILCSCDFSFKTKPRERLVIVSE